MGYKLKRIIISNIRNIKFGEVNFHNEGKVNSVVGIYGQNASGKSSVIKAIDFIRSVIDYRYDVNYEDKLIHLDEKSAYIDIEVDYDNDIIGYKVFLKINDNGKLYFEKEQIIYNGECVFDVNHELEEVNISSILNTNSEMELSIITEIAFETKKSCLGSKYAYEKLNDSKLVNNIKVIKAIYNLSSKINIIKDHENSSNNIDDNLVIFDLNEDGIDDLTIDLDNKGLVKKSKFEYFKRQYQKLNQIVSTIVPSLELVIDIEDRSEEYYRLGYYTKRIGVDSLIPLSEESYGIKKIISLAFSLIQVMNKKEFILIVDELDAGIFEYLLGQLIEIVDEYAQGQLIFTSHNLRAVEVLGEESVIFTTSNNENSFIKIQKHEKLNNMRDTYYRSILLGGQKENMYNETIDNEILMGMFDYE